MDDLLLEYEGSKPATAGERQRRRRLAATVTICGLAFVGIGQLSTGAWFTDQGSANMQFTTGDVQIALDSTAAVNGAGTQSLELSNINNMAPGDVQYQALEITNSGSLKLRYALTGTSVDTPGPGGGELSDVLDYDIYRVGDSAACSAAGVGSLTPLVSKKIGTAETPLLGDKDSGGQSGDRELAAGSGTEWLCVVTSLPGPVTGNEYAKATTSVTLTFYAEQTRNNA